MSFHVKRSITAQHEELSVFKGLRTTKWVQPPEGRAVLEIQHSPNPGDYAKIPEGKDYLVPPYHWHWYQEEFFTVRSGRYIFTLEGKDFTISASDPQPTKIPPTARHTFKVDPTSADPCVIEISTELSPHPDGTKNEDFGANERFFRNLYTYLDDCYLQGVEPSLPQLLFFLDSAEVSLAFPGPAWLMRPLSYAFGVVVGRWFGQYVLGYRAVYPEYYDPSRESRKGK